MDVVERAQIKRFLVVRVGDGGCGVGLPVENVVEVTRPLPVEAIAGAPAFVRGIAIVRASPIPVVDLAAVLGFDGTPGVSRFVVLRTGERNVAVAVRSVIDVTSLDGQSLRQAPPLLRDAPGELVDVVGTLDGELLFVLRDSRLVPDEVFDVIKTRAMGAS